LIVLIWLEESLYSQRIEDATAEEHEEHSPIEENMCIVKGTLPAFYPQWRSPSISRRQSCLRVHSDILDQQDKMQKQCKNKTRKWKCPKGMGFPDRVGIPLKVVHQLWKYERWKRV
jgi:hypothetical protein